MEQEEEYNFGPFGTAPIKAEGSAIEYGTGTITMKTTGRYNSAINSGTTMGNLTLGPATSIEGKPVELRPFMVNPSPEMLDDMSSPYNIDVETLCNLWVTRFGKGWVGNYAVEGMEEDQVEWWRHLANRLRELGYLEMHTLASSYRVVLRLVE